MENGVRKLPAHLEAMLSKQDVQLNRLPSENLLKLHDDNQVKVFVDRGLAIQAAASGVATSTAIVALSYLFPLLLLSAPFAWYFLSWGYALTAFILAIFSFRASRALIVAKVKASAFDNPRLMDLLISKGTLWFEGVPGSSRVSELTKVQETGHPITSSERQDLPPFEQQFGNKETSPPFFDLPPDHDGWHDILDSIVARLKPVISISFPSEDVGFVEAKCELIAYAAAYEGRLVAGSEIDRTVWNTFISSVENRIIRHIELVSELSGFNENADGSREFISYSSVYVSYMRALEKIIDRQYQTEEYNHIELLSVLPPKRNSMTSEATAKFNQIFEQSMFLCSDELMPTLEDFV